MSESVFLGLTSAGALIFLAVTVVTAVVVGFWVRHDYRQRLANSQAERDELESELDRQRAQRESAERDQALIEQSLTQLREQVDILKQELGDTRAERESWRQKAGGFENRLSALEADNQSLRERREQLDNELLRLREHDEEQARALSSARESIREYEVTLEEERRTTKEKLDLLERNRDSLKQEFENLANRIFDQKSERFSKQTKNSLDTLLNPFREQLQDFRKRVEDVYTHETKDRQALRSQIESLQKLNREITEEASNLTRALRGDKKVQGNWGELILERVLERSGLRKGVEYETQGSYRDGNGQLLRPDVVVHLPDERNVIVDSKVSLVAYQEWVREDEDEAARAEHLKGHIDAVRQHIRTLSEKDYSQLHGLHSPDFVLLFMPIEPAFVAAFQHDDNLFAEAFDRGIIVVTPTTLLATLRTIENIWRYERQSQNARQIADRAGAVYDKLRVFVESMERLGGQLQTAQVTYDSAMNTLTRGKGNLISQANRFVELGVRVRKELPKSVRDQAEVDRDELPDDEDREAGETGTSEQVSREDDTASDSNAPS